MILAVAVLAVEAAAAGAVAVRVARRVVPASDDILYRATVGLLIALVQVVGLLQLLGAVGLLNRWAALVGHVALAAVVLGCIRPGERAERRGGSLSVPTAVTVGIGTAFWSLAAVMSLGGPSQDFDTVQYHVPNAASWLRTGSTWALPYASPGYFTNAYPSNGELAGLWFMLPTHSDTLAYLAPLAFAILCVCGAALLAKELERPAWCGALAAIAVLAAPVSFSTQVHSLMVDVLAAGGIVTGVALALRAIREPERARWAVLAGLSIGLAVGAKDTALVPGVAAVVLIGVLAPAAWRLRRAGAAIGAVAVLSVFWFVRDLVDTGNPIFPEGLHVGSHDVLQGGQGPLTYYRTTVLQHLGHGDTVVVLRWAHLVIQEYGPVLVLLTLGLLASAWAARRARRRLVLGLLIVTAISAAAYLATPYTGGGPAGAASLISSQLRYALPAAILAAALTATMAPRAVAMVAAPALGFDGYRALQGPGFRHDLTPSANTIAIAALLTSVVIVGWVALSADGARIRDRVSESLRRRIGLAIPAVTIATGMVVVAGGLVLAALPGPGSADAVGAVLAREGRPGGPVVLVGSNDVRAVLGPDLQHHVLTVGTGGAADEVPVQSAAELDARIRQLYPAAIVVGRGGPGLPAGWVPPPGWMQASSTGNLTIYAHPRSTVATSASAPAGTVASAPGGA